MAEKYDCIPDVDIDTGRFKYILIRVHPHGQQEALKYLVRGYQWAAFHGDIYDEVSPELSKLGLVCECVGGGRIIHVPEQKKVHVFGYSQGYGRADHAKTCDLLKKKFPAYTDITWSDEGY
ncbi:14 kDa phosphohistidine phosphatase-like [Limulus polyphemus]|uniref:14 kDa phosphohistidine phosphatase-like n=1 Tax=Limulus polyphemus TaxID=6850 RepID=A0ABM1BLD2_LIMPO|nr:14 kDa phosphohistidine phosphatase-like [Limulus polyphemus]